MYLAKGNIKYTKPYKEIQNLSGLEEIYDIYVLINKYKVSNVRKTHDFSSSIKHIFKSNKNSYQCINCSLVNNFPLLSNKNIIFLIPSHHEIHFLQKVLIIEQRCKLLYFTFQASYCVDNFCCTIIGNNFLRHTSTLFRSSLWTLHSCCFHTLDHVSTFFNKKTIFKETYSDLFYIYFIFTETFKSRLKIKFCIKNILIFGSTHLKIEYFWRNSFVKNTQREQ